MRKFLGIKKINYLIFFFCVILLSCGNEPPLTVFIQPEDHSIFYSDTTVSFKINTSDYDGQIIEWDYSYNHDDFDRIYWKLDPPEIEILEEMNLEFTREDIGDHILTVFATDNDNATSEKTIHWTVKDFRSQFTGNWYFYSIIDTWVTDPPSSRTDTIEYYGYINIGSDKNELIARYTSNDSVIFRITRDGQIWDIDHYGTEYSSASFIGTDSIYMYLYDGAMGSNKIPQIQGIKQSSRIQQ